MDHHVLLLWVHIEASGSPQRGRLVERTTLLEVDGILVVMVMNLIHVRADLTGHVEAWIQLETEGGLLRVLHVLRLGMVYLVSLVRSLAMAMEHLMLLRRMLNHLLALQKRHWLLKLGLAARRVLLALVLPMHPMDFGSLLVEVDVSLQVLLHLQLRRALGLVVQLGEQLEDYLVVGQLLLFGFFLLLGVRRRLSVGGPVGARPHHGR